MPAFWKPEDCLLILDNVSTLPSMVAAWVAERVFRQDTSQPGFAYLSLPSDCSSFELRRLMTSLQAQLSRLFCQAYGQTLEYYSLGRFDQKKTTRLHLDGGPACSFLMLGYEPSEITSRFLVADYSRCATDIGLTAPQFLELKNPMLKEEGRQALLPYTQNLPEWDDTRNRIVILNNSSLPMSDPLPGLGVLHGAEILSIPEMGASRIINSTMFVIQQEAPTDPGDAIRTFLKTDTISGQIL